MQIDISRKLVDDNDDLQNTVVKWDDVINEEQFKLMVRIQPPESCNLLTEIPKGIIYIIILYIYNTYIITYMYMLCHATSAISGL